ncbi:conserved hypothetical protein [Pseudomonas sp. OF001]|uniref:hypothetical protein n=1 Tax=Pseudomonas sp. OF001 TaxID=2772300 RepID=UPI001918F5D2|nr:hypothetical protein [Pseudomonas sp. OF001]CAD5379375.1 conserved hypothetical protein [Pseudomonas sp. OF001]
MSTAINRSAWSRSSQRSPGGHYDEKATEYENIAYRCFKCFAGCVFTAEAQKRAYEVQKRFVWWLPSLCAQCQSEVERLKAEDKACQAEWNLRKEFLEKDQKFLRRWLEVIRSIPAYGKRANSSIEVMLMRCLEASHHEADV